MKPKSEFLLLLSRYITYILVFISSIITMEEDLYNALYFSFLFILVFINSYIRLNKIKKSRAKFIISVLIEVLLIMYMQYRFSEISFICFYIIIADVFIDLEFLHAALLALLIYIGMMTSIFLGDDSISLAGMVLNGTINAGVLAFFAGASYMIRFETKRSREMQKLNEELEASKEELEEANRKLSEYAKKVEDTAVLNERNRMAGEIHDTIGHSLTALIMEIDICGKLIDKDTEKAGEELKKASELARNALSEVRMSVRALKPQNLESLSGVKAIEELIREYQRNTGILVKFDVSKNQYKLSPTVEVTIYRTIQEALTNCAKHGQADIVVINLKFVDSKVELTIKDNGPGCRDITMGVGLKTMEERIAALGGTIKFFTKDGFCINANIPVEV